MGLIGEGEGATAGPKPGVIAVGLKVGATTGEQGGTREGPKPGREAECLQFSSTKTAFPLSFKAGEVSLGGRGLAGAVGEFTGSEI